MVQRYVESGADHKSVVLATSATAPTTAVAAGSLPIKVEAWSEDVVLDDTFSPRAAPLALDANEPSQPSWVASAIAAITNPGSTGESAARIATQLPPAPQELSTLIGPTLTTKPSVGRGVMGGVGGYYYPINPSALYDASRSLVQLVWSGYGLPSAVNASSGAKVGNGADSPAAGGGLRKSASSTCVAGQVADLLRLAQHVDELEDRNAILTAERDQAKAMGTKHILYIVFTFFKI